jgi:hypothetical protein
MLTEILRYVKKLFNTPSAETLALRELEDSKHKLLEIQSSCEYAICMRSYYEAKIKRLSAYLLAATETK